MPEPLLPITVKVGEVPSRHREGVKLSAECTGRRAARFAGFSIAIRQARDLVRRYSDREFAQRLFNLSDQDIAEARIEIFLDPIRSIRSVHCDSTAVRAGEVGRP